MRLFDHELAVTAGVGAQFLLRPRAGYASERDNILCPEVLGHPMRGRAELRVEHALQLAPAVAQADEDQLPEVAAMVHPAHQRGARADGRMDDALNVVRAY